MNYQLTRFENQDISIQSLNINSILVFASILFVPAAYVLVSAVFIIEVLHFNLKANKSSVLPLIYIFLGTVLSEYKLISSIFGLMMLLCMYTYYQFSNSNIDFNFKKTIYIVSMIVFIIGIIQYLNPNFTIPYKWIDAEKYNVNKRIYSTFFNPNVFGFYINFIIILCAENLNFKKINIEWIVYFTAVGCLILTFSRTSWIALILSLLLMSFLNRKYFKHAIFISTAIVIANYYLKTGRINISNAINDSSFLYRMEIWKASTKIISDNFTTGIGFGTLNKYIAAYSKLVSTKIEHAHSIYLQILTETGIAGALIFLYMLNNIARKLFSKIKDTNDNARWVTAMTVLIMILIHGMVDSVPLTPQIMMLLCIYGGALNNTETFQRTHL